MNAVEIEEAVSDLVAQPFDPVEFPFQFLAAFGNKDTTLKRLRSGSSNASDVPGGVLQRNNIHIAVAPTNAVGATLAVLRESSKTASARAKFILATDGATLEAEDLLSGETIAGDYSDLAQHFGFFLPLGGISTVKEIKNNPIDVKATGRLNKLYVELLKDNPDWATDARRHALNQFMARLIFCFFAEDTGIFAPQQFTDTIRQMSDSQAENTQEVLTDLFRAMDLDKEDRVVQKVRSWADQFPYVNGGLFTGATECPHFSRIARSYLLRVGELNWKEINPDIFGSMIQAVADDGERGELGMHYTSVPNILKVLNPLFLDDLRDQLEAAGNNSRKLRNLRKRLSTIRVFDPACGSGNFLVIAYREMRAIEAEIVRRLGDEQKRTVIRLSNFYGIEIKGFAAEVARLALLIAEFQADCRYLSQREARSMVLPLHTTGQIHVGNALQVDWVQVCPSAAPGLTARHDPSGSMGWQAVEKRGLEPQGGQETYLCGNPPYYGGKLQSQQQKDDLKLVFQNRSDRWGSLDYVAGWFLKASDYLRLSGDGAALVSTNSICQGQQVPILWPLVLGNGTPISFAHTSFRWSNLASRKAVVTVVIVGLRPRRVAKAARLWETSSEGQTIVREVSNINPYLIPGPDIIVQPASQPRNGLHEMVFGNMPRDDGHLLLSLDEKRELEAEDPRATRFVRLFQGSDDFIQGKYRGCVWVSEEERDEASALPSLARRMNAVAEARRNMKASSTQKFAAKPYRFVQIQGYAQSHALLIPRHSSEARPYLPVGLTGANVIIADSALAIYDSPIWDLAVICSRLHLVWIATVCGKIKTDFRYSNTLGWNTFPVPRLTEQNKLDLTRCAENILLAREACFPSTIAELYDDEHMPEMLRAAHQANDEILERIYIGRRFRNDTERLEKLFEMYDRSTSKEAQLPGDADISLSLPGFQA